MDKIAEIIIKQQTLFCMNINDIITSIKNELIDGNFAIRQPYCNFYGDCSGAIMFLFNYSRCYNDNQAYDAACKHVENLVEHYNSNIENIPSLSKFQWMIKYLSDNNFIEIEQYNENERSTINEYLFSAQNMYFKNGLFDYLHGGLSVGLYFLINNKKEEIRKMIDDISKLSEKDHNGLKWKSVTKLRTWEDKYNLSLSHGMSSLVVMLCKIYDNAIECDKTKQMIEGAIKYILAQKLPIGQYISIYCNLALESSETFTSSRLAWCYGDLCVAVALWRASKSLKRDDWAEEAKTILIHSSKRRDLNKNGVVDACFCHGTSGIAHIFNRMYKETGLYDCGEAATYWIEKTVEMSKFKDGLAGYKVWHGDNGFENEIGLLEGISGIGLTLLSYCSEVSMSWDECLLLS